MGSMYRCVQHIHTLWLNATYIKVGGGESKFLSVFGNNIRNVNILFSIFSLRSRCVPYCTHAYSVWMKAKMKIYCIITLWRIWHAVSILQWQNPEIRVRLRESDGCPSLRLAIFETLKTRGNGLPNIFIFIPHPRAQC